MVRRQGFIIIFFIVFLLPSLLEAAPSVDVPVRHWSYEAVEKLAILDLVDITDIGTRPVSRIKMAYIIKSAIEKTRDYEGEFQWSEQEYLEILLYHLIDEFREELVSIGVEVASIREEEEGSKKNLYKSPELEVDKYYAKTDVSNVLFENKQGWHLKEGFNLRARLNSWAKLGNLVALSLTPEVRYSSKDTDFDIEEGLVRFAYPKVNMELSASRSSMWWGPGFYGSLLMTDNAYPLDIVKINNVQPFRLPWILKKLGKFNAQFFVSRLEDKRAVPNAYISAWRLDYAPWNFLKFGFGHILMFGGKGVRKLGFSNFLSASSLVFSAAGGGSETENHIISGDIQLFIDRLDRFLSIATGAKLYTEWGGEDESGNIPVNLASITGIHVADMFMVPGFDIKMEFANFDKIWYSHFIYKSGYTHRGDIIGHSLGGDSQALSLTGIFSLPKEYKLATTLTHKRRGISRSTIETTDELRLEFNMDDAFNLYKIHDVTLDVFYELEDIKNYNNESSNNKRNHIFGVEIKRAF